jgi:hypothetical protein
VRKVIFLNQNLARISLSIYEHRKFRFDNDFKDYPFNFPKETTHQFLETTAGFEGLRASTTRNSGKPPVISPDLEERRGILLKFYLLLILSPSSTIGVHQLVIIRTN